MIEIRLASEEDVAGIRSIEEAVFSDPWSGASIAGTIRRDHVTALVARERDRVLGYLIYYHIVNEGEIARIAVDTAHHRMGIASRLLSAMIGRGEEERLVDYSLEVREGNVPAIALYESYGFLEEGRRKAYYHDPDEDALIMWRRGEEM